MRILLVDDSPKHRRAGVADLELLGHEVVALADYTEAYRLTGKEYFDVALLDLLMPAEGMTLGEEGMAFFGEPFPVGYPLAISLALSGIGLVAVATDTNHHNHPASAVMDWFRDSPFLVVQGKKRGLVRFLHAPIKEDGAKDWVKVLETLVYNRSS